MLLVNVEVLDGLIDQLGITEDSAFVQRLRDGDTELGSILVQALVIFSDQVYRGYGVHVSVEECRLVSGQLIERLEERFLSQTPP